LSLTGILPLRFSTRCTAGPLPDQAAPRVAHILEQALSEPETMSLLELQGLGKEVWAGTEAAEHVASERRAWD